MGNKDKDELQELIDNSSFGTEDAKALRDSAPKDEVDAIVDKIREELEKDK